MNLAQRLGEVAQRKAEEEANEQEDEDVYENEYNCEEVGMQSRQGGRSRNIGRGNEVKNTRGNGEAQDDEEEEDMQEEEENGEEDGEEEENDAEDNEGNSSQLFSI